MRYRNIQNFHYIKRNKTIFLNFNLCLFNLIALFLGEFANQSCLLPHDAMKVMKLYSSYLVVVARNCTLNIEHCCCSQTV